jgi:RHS repeat-associated protein
MQPYIPGWDSLTFNYTYDSMNRLTHVSCSGYSQHSETFAYTSSHGRDDNITSMSRGSSKQYTYGYVSGTNKLSWIEDNFTLNYILFQYDGKGRATKMDDYINGQYYMFTYGYHNLPVQTKLGSLTYNYRYDDAGMRVYREQEGTSEGREYNLRDHTGREVAIYDHSTNRIKMINLFGNGLEGKVNVSWSYVWVTDECHPDGGYWQLTRSDSKYFYMKDHLGNIRVTLHQNGNLASARDYYPYGETLRAYTTGGVGDRYMFTEKERDSETNLDYFGARYYSSNILRWLVPDPLGQKYPGVSPYVYAANNPLIFVDPDGREIRIYTGEEDEEGNRIYITYTAGMKYEGDNQYVSAVISRMNEIHITKSGSEVISTLISSENVYSIVNQISGDAAGAYSPRTRTLSLDAGLVADPYRNFDIAHELFHGYQHEVGFIKVGDRLVNAEIGGLLFSEIVMRELGYTSYVFRPEGSDFSNAMKHLLDQGFSPIHYWTAIQSFQKQSNFNQTGIYNNFNVVHPSLLPTPPIRRFLK